MTRNRLQAILVVSAVAAMLLLGPVRSDGQEIDFEYRCVILETPSSTDQTTTLPESIAEVNVGGTFYVEFWATDSGTTNTGLVSAYTDMGYGQDLVTCDMIWHTDLFDLFHEGVCDGSIVDELGGSQLDSDIGVEPEWARVAYVEFTAAASGLAEFVLAPADGESSAYNRGLITPSDIDYGNCSVACVVPRRPDPWPFEWGTCSGSGAKCRWDGDCEAGEACGNFSGACMTDSDCWGPSETVAYCVPAPGGTFPGTCYAPANRYISIARNPSQLPNTARRITLQGGGAGPWWVGAPELVVAPCDSFYRAVASDTPVYAGIDFPGDWPDVVHVTCCVFAPGYTYLVQTIQSGQDINDEADYSEALALRTAPVWGDIVSTCPYDHCLPPTGGFTEPSIDDVLAVVNHFTGVCNGPTVWFDVDPVVDDGCPDGFVTIGDVLAVVNAFSGQPYPGNGPLGCQ